MHAVPKGTTTWSCHDNQPFDLVIGTVSSIHIVDHVMTRRIDNFNPLIAPNSQPQSNYGDQSTEVGAIIAQQQDIYSLSIYPPTHAVL